MPKKAEDMRFLHAAVEATLRRFQRKLGKTLVDDLRPFGNCWRAQRAPMPDFSPTLPGLLGISAGTYLGFKFAEQKG